MRETADNFAIFGRTTGAAHSVYGSAGHASYGGVMGASQDGTKFGVLGHSNTYGVYSVGNVIVYGTGTTCTIGDGTGATNCTSDERLKKNVEPIQNALDKIVRLNGVTFHWKDPSKTGVEHIGVIAQDIEKVFPQVVRTVSDTTLGTAKTVDIAALVAPLIEAVKELHAANDNLKVELETLRQEVKDLRGRK